jgi:hypothetical protein
MKIIHIESGLGNQMLSFCEYLAIKKVNPDDDIYIENIVFDIPECNEVVNQWNGYELEKVFGIKVPNVRSLFNNQEWEFIINDIKRKGYNVRRDMIILKNRYGEPVRIARYSFAEEGNADNRVQSCG